MPHSLNIAWYQLDFTIYYDYFLYQANRVAKNSINAVRWCQGPSQTDCQYRIIAVSIDAAEEDKENERNVAALLIY